MLIINGQEVIDLTMREFVDRGRLRNTAEPVRKQSLKFIMDGTTGIRNAVDLTPFTMTGGVGGAWTEASNFRTLLGAQAPVIAQAADNLLSDENASFEGGTTGTWADIGGDMTLTNSGVWASHGAKSLKCICSTTVVGRGTYNVVTATTSAGSQYTGSAVVYNPGASSIIMRMVFYDNVTGYQVSSDFTIAAGATAVLTKTATFHATSTTRFIGVTNGAGVGAAQTWYVDSAQLETGAVQTPFALNSRTSACTMTIPTATIGLVPGGAMSALFVVNTPYAGNDGASHTLLTIGGLYSANSIAVLKAASNELVVYVFDGAGTYLYRHGVVNATNWAANSPHVIILSRPTASMFNQMSLDGVSIGSLSGNGGTGVESSLAANTNIGTITTGANPVNSPILCAIEVGRVWTPEEIAYYSKMLSWFPELPTVVN